jgi:hypothetical protein
MEHVKVGLGDLHAISDAARMRDDLDEGLREHAAGVAQYKARWLDIETRLTSGEISIVQAATEARIITRDATRLDTPIPYTVADATSDAPAARLKKDGTPAARPGRKAKPPAEHVTAGRTSPLTEIARNLLLASMRSGPVTVAVIAAEAGLVDPEALLCEDPAAFVSWKAKRPGDSERVVVWGTVEQFDREVGGVQLNCTKSERAKWTASALDCSVAAAHDAWLRLDPPGAS